MRIRTSGEAQVLMPPSFFLKGISQTYYRWRKQYGGMGTNQLKELRRLQKENERLRKADQFLSSLPHDHF